MDEALVKAYRKARKEYPLFGSKQALLIARELQKPLRFDFEPGLRHLAHAEVEDGPFTIVATVDYDDCGDRHVEFTDKNTGIRNPDFRWADGDGPYRYRNDPQKGCRYIELESEYTLPQLAEDFRGYGMARNVAWETARQSLDNEARMFLSEDYNHYVVTVTVVFEGAELGSASIGTDSDGSDDERTWNETIEETGLVEEAMAEARAKLARLANIAS